MHPGEDRHRRADRLALSLRGAIERIIIPLSSAAAVFVRERAWFAFGFARLEDHARERFGRSARWVRDLVVLGEALQKMPRLAAALTGDDLGRPIGWVAALAVARIATPETLTFWIGQARASTVRDLHDAVRRARAAPHVGGDTGQADRSAADDADDGGDRDLVRLLVPATVAEAFDEALELHRAVEGHQASVTSFIELLVAESAAGATPSDVDIAPLRTGSGAAAREQVLARATESWSRLPPAHAAGWAFQLAEDGLETLRIVAGEAGMGDSATLDRQIRTLLQLEAVLQARLGRLLAEMGERGDWSRLMFAGVGHYGEERLRISRTVAEDRVRAARALRSRPRLRAAYESGRLGLEAALIITRILGSGAVREDIEQAWVDRGVEATIKRLRDEAHAFGRRGSLGERASITHIGSDEESRASQAPDANRPLEDVEWQASLSRPAGRARRRVLRLGFEALLDAGGDLPGGGGSGAETGGAEAGGGRAGGGRAKGAGTGRTAVGDASIGDTGVAGPDVFLRFHLPSDLAAAFVAAIESRRLRLTSTVEQIPWHEPSPDPGAMPSLFAARMFSTRSRRVPSWVGLLSILEEFVCTWDAPTRAGTKRAAVTDAIYIRDGWRCTAPGCTSRRNLEDHHLVYRSRGGDDGPANRTCLCRFHHQRGEHGGLASCAGTAPLGIVWRLGRPEVAQAYRNERRLPGATGVMERARSYFRVGASP